MSPVEFLLLFGVGVISSIINAIGGGGTFIAFPIVVILGTQELHANATVMLGLLPGIMSSAWVYRHEFTPETKAQLPYFIIVSLIGAAVGAGVLLFIPNSAFAYMVPYLLLVAALIFTFQRYVLHAFRAYAAQRKGKTSPIIYRISVTLGLLIISMYGGFFGAGAGILVLALLGMMGMVHIHQMNALRACSAACMSLIAVSIFMAFPGMIVWAEALALALGATVGGYYGTHYIRRVSPEKMRKVVIVCAWAMTVYFFIKAY